MRFLVFVFTVLVCFQTQAASLRTMTSLHGPAVYLRDLFDDAGSNADRVLGPGPEPGGRIILEAAQLNAIARQYSVAWPSAAQGRDYRCGSQRRHGGRCRRGLRHRDPRVSVADCSGGDKTEPDRF